MRFDPRTCHVLLLVLAVAACDGGDLGPGEYMPLTFDQEAVALGQFRTATVVVLNNGTAPVGPIDVAATPVVRAGVEIPGVIVTAEPAEIPTLNGGDTAHIQVTVTGAGGLLPGTYSSRLLARIASTSAASASVSFDVLVSAGNVGDIEIGAVPTAMRQGDVYTLSAIVHDTLGAVIPDATISWSTLPLAAGLIRPNGEYVPYKTGAVSLVARLGAVADTLQVDVTPRNVAGSFAIVGSGPQLPRFTSDLWVYGSHAITGTWGFREEIGNAIYAWDISGPTPVITDSLFVNAFTVNDVMIRADGQLAVATHEYMPTEHAITLIDMSDPAHPTVAGEYHSDEPTGWIGVHNAWLDGDYAYIAVDGTASNRGLWILDISDPSNPVRVGRFYGGSSFLHDMIVRDGLAFLSHWDAGLIILDVGHGIRGGTPSNPVEVSRIVTSGEQVHNAWYWPERGLVFIGEEDFTTPGRLHVVDVSDLENPVEIASMRIQGDTPHNYWMDEGNEILFTSWYSRGIQAVDVSGDLRGNLELQGRIVASIDYAGPGTVEQCPAGVTTCAMGPQLHTDGYLYVADMNLGLWKFQPNLP